MKVHEGWFPSHVREVSPAECDSLLESQQVGRIAFNDPSGPVVLPVNYVFADGRIVVATSPYGSIARYAVGTAVAFEVDALDDFTETGWSVVVRGTVGLLEIDELARADLPGPWADGTRTLIIKIVPAEITGKRLIPV